MISPVEAACVCVRFEKRSRRLPTHNYSFAFETGAVDVDIIGLEKDGYGSFQKMLDTSISATVVDIASLRHRDKFA